MQFPSPLKGDHVDIRIVGTCGTIADTPFLTFLGWVALFFSIERLHPLHALDALVSLSCCQCSMGHHFSISFAGFVYCPCPLQGLVFLFVVPAACQNMLRSLSSHLFLVAPPVLRLLVLLLETLWDPCSGFTASRSQFPSQGCMSSSWMHGVPGWWCLGCEQLSLGRHLPRFLGTVAAFHPKYLAFYVEDRKGVDANELIAACGPMREDRLFRHVCRQLLEAFQDFCRMSRFRAMEDVFPEYVVLLDRGRSVLVWPPSWQAWRMDQVRDGFLSPHKYSLLCVRIPRPVGSSTFCPTPPVLQHDCAGVQSSALSGQLCQLGAVFAGEEHPHCLAIAAGPRPLAGG